MPSDEIPEITKAAVRQHVRTQIERSMINLARIRSLLKLAEQQKDGSEIARAAVVFTHAMTEDFLRTLGAACLPEASEAVLNLIPLAGSKDALRPEKFFLGRLADYRGARVDDVIVASVKAYLDRLTFNSTTEIVAHLKACGIDVQSFEQDLPELGELISRRHQIVHKADLPEGSKTPAPLDASTVVGWVLAVTRIMGVVAGEYAGKRLLVLQEFQLPDESS